MRELALRPFVAPEASEVFGPNRVLPRMNKLLRMLPPYRFGLPSWQATGSRDNRQFKPDGERRGRDSGDEETQDHQISCPRTLISIWDIFSRRDDEQGVELDPGGNCAPCDIGAKSRMAEKSPIAGFPALFERQFPGLESCPALTQQPRPAVTAYLLQTMSRVRITSKT